MKTKTNSQRKKDKDDGSNVSLSGDTKQLRGKTNKDEHMPLSVDNHADSRIHKSSYERGVRPLNDDYSKDSPSALEIIENCRNELMELDEQICLRFYKIGKLLDEIEELNNEK